MIGVVGALLRNLHKFGFGCAGIAVFLLKIASAGAGLDKHPFAAVGPRAVIAVAQHHKQTGIRNLQQRLRRRLRVHDRYSPLLRVECLLDRQPLRHRVIQTVVVPVIRIILGKVQVAERNRSPHHQRTRIRRPVPVRIHHPGAAFNVITIRVFAPGRPQIACRRFVPDRHAVARQTVGVAIAFAAVIGISARRR